MKVVIRCFTNRLVDELLLDLLMRHNDGRQDLQKGCGNVMTA